MKKLPYLVMVKYTVAGLFTCLLFTATGAIVKYSRGFHGSVFNIFRHSPAFIVLVLSPLFLSLFLGFIGFRREQLVRLNHFIKKRLFREEMSPSSRDRQLKLLARAVSQVNEAIVILTESGKIEWINEGFTQMNGYTLEEVKGKGIDKLLHGPLTDHSVAEKMIRKLKNGEAVAEELLIYHKNGKTIWLSVSIKPIFDAKGEISTFIAIHNNITNRKENLFALEKLYREVSDYKLALDQSAIVLRFNHHGKIIYANDNFCKINELSKEEVIGHDYPAVNVNMSDEAVVTPIWDALNQGKTWKGELINRTANGKIYWADTTIVPLLSAHETAFQFLAIQQDITERKLLEEQVLSSKNKLHEAMKIARIGSWEIDSQGVLTVSAELRQLYNLPAEGSISVKEVSDHILIEDIPKISRIMARSRAGLQDEKVEYRCKVGGQLCYMISNIKQRLNENGEHIGSFGTVQDVTASKLTAIALQKSEEQKAVILNNTQTIICLHDMDGVIIDINAAAEKMSGFTKREMTGNNLKSIISPLFHSEFKEYLHTINNREAANGTLQIITKSGNKRVWLYQNTVYRNEGDRPYVIASAVDITDSVKTRNEVERQQQFISQIIDNSPNVIFVLNEAGEIVLANANFSQFYSFKTDTVPTVSGIKPGPEDILLEDINGIFELEEGEMIRREGSQKNVATGGLVWFNIIKKCFKEKNGKKYVLVFGTDITVRHDAEIELIAAKDLVERALKVKDQFISNMSHEIRTPLNAVVGFTDLLAGTPLNKEQTEFVKIVRTASANLLSLINNILDLSKIESKNLELENVPIDIIKIIKDVIKILDGKAKIKDLVVNCHIAGEHYMVMGDQLRLTQVLFNLLGNAIKFTDVGTIDIYCKRVSGDSPEKEYIAFSIQDTGIGVAEDKQAEIFDRFTQANANTQRLYGGSGLGLNITKSIIELYGGILKVQSQPGKGTTFYFIIPFNRYTEQEQCHEALPEVANSLVSKRTGNPIHILLAEDNSVNAMLAKLVLTKKGFTVEHVMNGELALQAVKDKYCDVVLMDIQMPVMNGIDSARSIRKLDGELSLIPIIAMTAHSLQGEMQNCFDAGMNGYVAKPFKPENLFSTIFYVINEANRNHPNDLHQLIETQTFL